MSECAGHQFVGIDLHLRGTVMVRTTMPVRCWSRPTRDRGRSSESVLPQHSARSSLQSGGANSTVGSPGFAESEDQSGHG